MSSITERRKARGWTKAILAAVAGLCRDTIRAAESGGRVSKQTLRLIDAALESAGVIARPARKKPTKEPKPKTKRAATACSFDRIDPERHRQIASQGGKKAHEIGAAHEFTPEQARVAGKLGGERVSQNREHMRAIAAKGGRKRGENLRARANRLPAVSVLTAPVEEDWGPELEALGSPITGGEP